MSDKFTFIITILGIAGGTVSFTFGTFATKDYLREVVIQRLDRIENKLDRLIESKVQQGVGRAHQSRQKHETSDYGVEGYKKGPCFLDRPKNPRSFRTK
jgi:hypothetical protein